jgi:hypothetical protein
VIYDVGLSVYPFFIACFTPPFAMSFSPLGVLRDGINEAGHDSFMALFLFLVFSPVFVMPQPNPPSSINTRPEPFNLQHVMIYLCLRPCT